MWFLRRHQSNHGADADKAIQDAQTNLKRVERRGSEVSKVSDALREIRERNHFAEQMEDIILRRGKASQ